ncbi:hypothetical protein Tco_1032056 [Tanacetum coccineum]|uniref:Uncharacterized protein n=1 Tax=Tanacetum coccineum TaxID=301880 RepID=A0ABQ5GAR6_9ASTR
MHTLKDDYLINTLRFVSRKEASQIYGAVLPECLTSPEMKESKAYKTYFGHATGVVSSIRSRKIQGKLSKLKKDSDLIPVDEEPVTKGKRVKRSVKKSLTKPATGIVIKEPPIETKYKGKEKEKVDVAHGKGIELLSEVALTEKAQLKEVRKKSLRDFHKTHPKGSGTGVENPPSVEKITPTITSEGTGDKLGVPDVTKDDSTESESESWGNDEDDSNNEQEASDEGKEEEVDQENEYEDDEIESDEDKGMDDTTDQFDDDTTQEQVVEDDHVTISTVMKKTEVPATSSSRSSDLALKFLNFLDIPHTDAEIVSPLDVHVHHEVSRTQALTLLIIPVSVITKSSPVYTNIPQSLQTFTPLPILTTPTSLPTIEATNPLSTFFDFASVFRFNDRITALEKEVAELKKDPLHTQVTTLVDEHLNTRLGETRDEFMKFLSESLTTRMKEQVKDQLPQILPKEVSNFAPPVIEKLIKESRDEVTLAKVSSQPQSTYETASTLTEFELRKILLDKMEKSESYLTAPEHRDCYDGLKKYYALEKDCFYSYDVYSLKRGRKDKDKDEDPFDGSDQGLKKRKLSKDAEPTTVLMPIKHGVEKITPTITSEGTGDKLGVPDVTKDDSTESKSESCRHNIGNEAPLDGKEVIQGLKVLMWKMIDAQPGNENLETTQEQVVEDDHVTISTVTKKTEVPATSSSRSSDLALKFLNFSDILILMPQKLFLHRCLCPPCCLEKSQAPCYSYNTYIRLGGETREEFMNFLSESFTARIKEQVKDQLPQIMPHEMFNFAPPVIKKLFHETRYEKILLDKMEKSESYLTAPEHRECYDGLKKSYALDQDFFYSYDVYTIKRGRKDKDKDEDPSAGSDRGLKRRKTNKDAEPTTDPKKKDSTSGSSKGTKSQPRSSGKSV